MKSSSTADTFEQLLEEFEESYDSLITFLGLAEPQVFNFVNGHRVDIYADEQLDRVTEEYGVYQKQVVHAAFLLGYSYIEAFLQDLARQVYFASPLKLPSGKRLRFEEVLSFEGDYNAVLQHMVETTLYATFHGSMDNILTHFEKEFGFIIPGDAKQKFIEGSLIRNCIIHKRAVVDPRLVQHNSQWSTGDLIILSIDDVHEYGWHARQLANQLTQQAVNLHATSKV